MTDFTDRVMVDRHLRKLVRSASEATTQEELTQKENNEFNNQDERNHVANAQKQMSSQETVGVMDQE
jgi:hypothetical protein